MRFIQRHPYVSFVLLVLATPYGVLLPLLLAGVEQESLKPLKLLFAFTPLVFACLVTSRAYGEEGIARLFGKFWTREASAIWCGLALSMFVGLGFAALGLRYAIDGFFPPREEFASLPTILSVSLPLLFFPGITEEFAWRGLLQSGLQRRLSWWWASLLVGLVWGTWHGFDFLLGNWTFAWNTFWAYPLFIVSNSILIGWAYKESGESVFVAMLAHFSSNCVNFFMPVFEEYHGSVLPAVFYIGGLCLTTLAFPVIDCWRGASSSRACHHTMNDK